MASAALPVLPDDVLEEIFLCLPTVEDLARASMARTSFRRVITGHSFLRRFRAIHSPPLLGILSATFHVAEPPHPSAAIARTFANADLSRSFLSSPERWHMRDFRDGRALLSAVPEGSRDDPRAFVMDLAVGDLLHRRYLPSPTT